MSMIIKTIRLLFFIYLPVLICSSQPFFEKDNHRIRVLFYNTENLFDIYDDSTKSDNEFLPFSYKKWTAERFETKINNIYKVIVAAGEGIPPEIIGLCEVENQYVLNKLVHSTPLKKYEYSVIHYDSPDIRGIDVAFLYQKRAFRPVISKPINIKLANQPGFKTRDILYVKGIINKTDTLHVFVNHWPSRRGGQAKSEEKRIAAAKTLKYHTDSILIINNLANVVIMGDFNDEADDISISEYLICNRPGKIIPLIPLKTKEVKGTHKYRGKWTVLDQFFVSSHLLDSTSILYKKDTNYIIFDSGFLLIEDEKYTGLKPFSTYSGSKYTGGFSDHLPIIFDLFIK